jgi:transcriptional regulator with XRE-family HTH domain
MPIGAPSVSAALPVDALIALIGERIRAERLRQDLTQATLADKAGISPRALRTLEAGGGAQLTTLVRTMKALGAESALLALLPEPTISPMAMIERKAPRQRGRR